MDVNKILPLRKNVSCLLVNIKYHVFSMKKNMFIDSLSLIMNTLGELYSNLRSIYRRGLATVRVRLKLEVF